MIFVAESLRSPHPARPPWNMTSFRTLRRLALAAAMLSSSAAFPHHMGAPALSALTTGRGAHPSVTASPARLRHQPRKPGRAGRALLGLRASIPPGDTEAETRAAEQKGGAAAQARSRHPSELINFGSFGWN